MPHRSRFIARTRLLAGASFLALALAGCVGLPRAPAQQSVQLGGVPAYAQDDLQCGPAALASVLGASGLDVGPEDLRADLFIPARGGSLQVELAAQARERGRVPLMLAPTEQALIAALEAGHPPLVLLNLRLPRWPQWHYAAVTGYDPVDGYTLHDGRAKPSRVPRARFLRQWNWADRWAMTVHAPAAIPPYAEAAPWVAAAAPLQRRRPADALAAYRAAVQHWPEAPLAWAALGEARFAAGDAAEALANLRRARTLAPQDPAILNNLASVELAQGCVRAAGDTLAAADGLAAAPAVAQALAATRAEIAAAGADRCMTDAAR